MPGSEVQAISAGEADEDDIATLLANPLRERCHEIRPRWAHVVTDGDDAGPAVFCSNPKTPDECRAHLMSEIGVELVWDDPANVVGLDDVIECSHVHNLPSDVAVTTLKNP